jgi:mono/diheme cytochrome c family protein
VAAGWGGAFGLAGGGLVDPSSNGGLRRVLVFRLGATGALPALQAVERTFPDPMPEVSATPVVLAQGRADYFTHCQVCHGNGVISGSSIPDLRYSAVTMDPAAWRAVMIDGTLAQRGMIAFAEWMTPEQAEGLRQFVLSEAHVWKRQAEAP